MASRFETCRITGRIARRLSICLATTWTLADSPSTTRPNASRCTSVSDNYFSLLGVQPAIGRLIQPNEGRARGDAPVLVLTHAYWLARFGGDPSVVGRLVRLNGKPFTIIGVTAQSFDKAHTLITPSAYMPLWMHDDLVDNAADDSTLEGRGKHQQWVLGRLKPGISLSQARASLQVTTAALAREYPETNKDSSLVVIPETHARPNPNIGPFFRVAGTAFAALAVLLLLITSANVTNLLMARAASREREVSLRAALGAGRGRLVRQLLTESVVLALLASAVAMPIAILALRSFERGMAGSTQIATLRPDFSLDSRLLGIALLLTLAAGIVSGLAPALMAARADLNLALKAGGRGASGELRAWFRSVLVVGQVALSLMLLVSGGLFVRSLDRARQIELGFDPDNVLVASAIPSDTGYDPAQRLAYYSSARERMLALPGVERAAWIEWAPLSTVSEGGPIRLESQPTRADEPPPMAAVARADPGYFATAHIPILDGRTFTDRDDDSAEPVAIVNQTLATQFWPNLGPVGRFFVVQGSRVQVVGVVPNGKYLFIWESPRPMVFRPLRQSAPGRATLVVRSTRRPAELLGELRRTLRDVDPAVFVYDVRTMDEHLVSEGGGFLAFELGATVTSVFGAARRTARRHRSLRDDCGPGLATHAGVRRAHRARSRSRRHPARCARPRHAPDLDWHRRWCCPGGGRGAGTLHAVARHQSVRSAHLCRRVSVSRRRVRVRVFHPRASSDARRSHRRAASGVVDVDSRDVHAPPLDVQASSTGR